MLKIVFRTGATAASLGATTLEKTAELLRGLAGDAASAARQREPSPEREPVPERTGVPVERRGEARRLEPVVAPEDQPDNPAAPAGADPDATSGTGPVPRRVSNPKAARKVRQRQAKAKASGVQRLETKGKARGARPSSADAEPSPAKLAENGAGRQPAPMGSSDDSA